MDEYDKPLLDNITDSAAADEIREGLKNFYSVIKEQDANLEVGEEILSPFEIERIQVETLLFQSGYMTIKKVDSAMDQQIFTLGLSNF